MREDEKSALSSQGFVMMCNCHLPPHQPKFEAVLSEIDAAINELHYTINNLSSWMKPEYVSKNLVGQ